MIIQWTEDALSDLRALRRYIVQDKPCAANNISKKILHSVNLLSEHPEMGKAGRMLGTRELIVSGTPYIIPYRVKKNAIQILRVFHAAMRWPFH